MNTCPYCHQPAVLVTGEAIYPHRPDLHHKMFWQCKPCSAFVGCHEAGVGQGDGTKPLGRLANAELRQWKQRAHAAFDPMWKARRMNRRDAYAWLSQQMGIKAQDCHIGMFDVAQCRAVVEAVDAWRMTA